MNDIRFKGTVLLLLAFLANSAFGQTHYEVVVNSAFSPVIRDAQQKISFPATVIDTNKFNPKVDYDINITNFRTDFVPEPISAPKLGKDRITRLYQHYVKAGFGYLQPLLDYNYSTLRSKKQAFGLRLYTHSSFNGIKDCAPANYSNSFINIYAQQFLSKLILNQQINYDYNTYHCYGYPADSLKKLYGWSQDAKDILRSYHHANLHMKAYTNNHPKSTDLNQLYLLNYDFLYGNLHSLEHQVNVGTKLNKRIMSSKVDYFRIGGNLDFKYFNNSWDNMRQTDTWIGSIGPYVELEEDNWKIHAGFDVAVEIVNGDGQAQFFPNITAYWDIVPSILSFYAGATGAKEKYSLIDISRENPYLSKYLDLGIDDYYDFYLGTTTNLSKNLSFGAKVSYIDYSSLPYFMPDTVLTAMNDSVSIPLYNQFVLNSGEVQSTNLHVDILYRYKENLKLGLNFDYFSYVSDSAIIYYKPHYILGINANYSMKQKLNFALYMNIKSEVYAPKMLNGTWQKYQLPTYFDLSFWSEYNWSKRLHFFMQLNNIIGRRNQIYAFYYTERFNCMFGAKYIFGGE